MAELLIGVSGYARSGKDSIAAALVERCDFIRISFADRIKELALYIRPELHERVETEGWEEVKADPEVRELLQRLGFGCREVLGEDVWVDAAMQGLAPDRRYVFSDVRFPNEAAGIRRRGGFLIRVTRPGISAVNGHISEVALDDWPSWDAAILNDGTLDDLRETAVRLAQRFEVMARKNGQRPSQPVRLRASEAGVGRV